MNKTKKNYNKNKNNKNNNKNNKKSTLNKSRKQYGGQINQSIVGVPFQQLSTEAVTQKAMNTIQSLESFVENSYVTQNVKNAIHVIIGIFHTLLQKLNNEFLNQDVQNDFKIAVVKLSIFSTIFLTAMEKPIIKSMDVFRNASTEFLEGLSTGVIGIIVSSLGAIPFYGAIIDMGKAMNNAVEIAKDTSQLVKTSVETFQDVIDETKNNIDNMGDISHLGGDINLTNKINTALAKKSDEVIQRTGNSIQQFELPLTKSKVN